MSSVNTRSNGNSGAMEDKNHHLKDKPTLKRLLMRQTLASWRFLLLFSIPPCVWGLFIASLNLAGIVIVILCAIVWFGCWRLWLDERYFRFISEANNDIAGEALYSIWGREKLQQCTFADRYQGALNVFRQTMWFTGMLWVVWLVMALWLV